MSGSHFYPSPRGRRGATMLAALLGAVLWLAGCSHPGMRLHDHPLAGHLIDVDRRVALSPSEAVDRMAASDAVLLGEVHDNPIHHRLQLEVLRAVADRRAPVLAMEQFDSEHQTALDAAQADPGASADALADAGELSREGWGWPLYEPLVAEAVKRRLPVVAINLSRAAARRVAREGFEGMPAGAGRDVVEAPWTADRQATLEALITEGHCGQVSPEILAMIVRAQRARDATMAERIAPTLPRGVVAILGGGHARRDLAVPIYLARLAPAARVLSVGLVEVQEGADAPGDYPAVVEGQFDLVWFTPRFDRPDPCAALSAAGMGKAMAK